MVAARTPRIRKKTRKVRTKRTAPSKPSRLARAKRAFAVETILSVVVDLEQSNTSSSAAAGPWSAYDENRKGMIGRIGAFGRWPWHRGPFALLFLAFGVGSGASPNSRPLDIRTGDEASVAARYGKAFAPGHDVHIRH